MHAYKDHAKTILCLRYPTTTRWMDLCCPTYDITAPLPCRLVALLGFCFGLGETEAPSPLADSVWHFCSLLFVGVSSCLMIRILFVSYHVRLFVGKVCAYFALSARFCRFGGAFGSGTRVFIMNRLHTHHKLYWRHVTIPIPAPTNRGKWVVLRYVTA